MKTLSSYGIGLRMNLYFLPLRIDWAWPREKTKVKCHFSLGYDF